MAVDERDLVISALAKAVLEECPTDSIVEAIETWEPILRPYAAGELDAVRSYFASRPTIPSKW